MRKIRVIVASALVTLLMAAPTSAAPPERSDEPIFLLFPDLENGVAVFWNITRDNFCTWFEGGTEGPPPVEMLIPTQLKETGKGALVGSFQATSHIELWQFDADVPPLIDACVDTDEQTGPWAVGTAHVAANDNDLDVSLTRVNSFGDRGQATLTEVATGDAWHYSWTFRASIHGLLEDGEGEEPIFDFRVATENFNLHRIGKR